MTLKNPNALVGIGGAPTRNTSLPTDAAERKKYPMASGLLDYFPDALAEVSHVSWVGNEQHNPGQPLHWARGKSSDEADTTIRHLSQRGTRDIDGQRHTAKAAWRVLAILQKEIEAELEAKEAVILSKDAANQPASESKDPVVDSCFYRPPTAPVSPKPQPPLASKAPVAERVRKLVSEYFGISNVNYDTPFFGSLTSHVSLALLIDDAFHVWIPYSEAKNIKTVGDLVLYVQAKV